MPDLLYDPFAAAAHLRAALPALAPLVDRVGPPSYTARGDAPYDALLRAIAHQQLNGKAARTIHGRVLAAVGAAPDGASDPAALLALPDDALRACGLSRAKTAAVQDLARRTLDGTVPATAEALAGVSDDEAVARLTAVRGVGRWTVEMLLLFGLGRADVWPVDDYAVRLAYARLLGRPKLTALQLREAGEPLRPYRSAAAWYGWRLLDPPLAA